MLCPKCNFNNKNSNNICEHCGEKLSSNDINLDLLTAKKVYDEKKINSAFKIFSGFYTVIGGLIFSALSLFFFFKGINIITKIMCIPFLICGITVLIYGISTLLAEKNNKKINDEFINGNLNLNKIDKNEKQFQKIGVIVSNIYIFGFLLFWFGFLIILDLIAIKSWNDEGSYMFAFSLIFWIFGIYVLKKLIKK